MFPIVRYTGYAVFVPNVTTRVLSEEMRSGMIVTPPNSFSSSTCRCVSYVHFNLRYVNDLLGVSTTISLCASQNKPVSSYLDQYNISPVRGPKTLQVPGLHRGHEYIELCHGDKIHRFDRQV